MERGRHVLALVAFLLTILPWTAHAAVQMTGDGDGGDERASVEGSTLVTSADEQDDETMDDSSKGLEENEMYGEAPGEPIEFGRRQKRYLYLFKRLDAFWDSHRVWCICELPGMEQTLFEPDVLYTWTQEEHDDCVGFGVLVGSITAGTLAFLATSPTSPAGLAAMAATAGSREYLMIQSVTVGGFVGQVVAARLCPKPEPSHPPHGQGWNGQCPCNCPPCASPPCPPCPCPPPCCPPDVICKEGEL